jgi:hypothetical protein
MPFSVSSIVQNLPRPPPKAQRQAHKTNPLKLLTSLTKLQYAQFGVGYLAWTMDAFDFFGKQNGRVKPNRSTFLQVFP